MSEKREGSRLEDFLSLDDIETCKAAQQLAVPLLPALAKLPDLIKDVANLKDGYKGMEHRINDSLTASDLARELGLFEQSVEAKFNKLIDSNLDTNNSINSLSNNINLLCQRLDNSIKDYDRLEKSLDHISNTLRNRISKIDEEQKNIRIDIAEQSGSLMTAKHFIPTIVSLVSMAGVIYAIFFKSGVH